MDWLAALSALLGAVIGAGASLLAVRQQMKQLEAQRRRDELLSAYSGLLVNIVMEVVGFERLTRRPFELVSQWLRQPGGEPPGEDVRQEEVSRLEAQGRDFRELVHAVVKLQLGTSKRVSNAAESLLESLTTYQDVMSHHAHRVLGFVQPEPSPSLLGEFEEAKAEWRRDTEEFRKVIGEARKAFTEVARIDLGVKE